MEKDNSPVVQPPEAVVQDPRPVVQPTLSDLIGDGRHFCRQNNSFVEIIDSITGKLVAALKSPYATSVPLEKITLPNGEEVWRDVELPTNLLENYAYRGIVPFSPWMVDIICEKIAEGTSLTKICRQPGMPSYAVLCRWKRDHPEIADQLENARQDRAEYHRDQALEEAQAADEDNATAQTLKHNAHKWAAGVDNAKFSPKAKIEANLSVPTQIIVDTGIRREEPRTVNQPIMEDSLDEVGANKKTTG